MVPTSALLYAMQQELIKINGDIVNYKSYEFSDSSFTTATITDMVEQYWPNISGNTYGLVRYSNNSSIWIGTYIKYGNDDGAITINGISAYSPFQRGVLIKTVWKWDPIVANSDLGIVIKNSGTVAAVANADVQIATITLPANHKYLILAHTNTNRGDNNSIINCSIKKISGTVSSSFGMEDARTIMNSGGGCTTWGIVDTATSCVYGLSGYGYSSMDYNYIGKICAIQLS